MKTVMARAGIGGRGEVKTAKICGRSKRGVGRGAKAGYFP